MLKTEATDVTGTTAERGQGFFAKHGVFLAVLLAGAGLAWQTWADWARLSWSGAEYSHLCLIPVISAYLIYVGRKRIFARVQRANDGIVLAVLGIAVFVYAHWAPVEWDLSVAMLGFFLFAAGAFRFWYGRQAWPGARFAFAFLVFAIPLPASILDQVIRFLQVQSAAVVDVLFNLSGVPYVRSGLQFDLIGLSIQIAPECSGIRSTTAILILGVLFAYMVLRSWWRRLLLIAIVIPLVLFKNGLRIATLSVMAAYVDRRYITGPIHHEFGGLIFGGMMIVTMVAFGWFLRKTEKAPGKAGGKS